jgi:hypothetical protein
MKIQGIEVDANELNVWDEKLKEAFLNPQQAGQDQRGHKYLYIDREGHFQSFSLNENIPQGHYKLSVDDIVKVSKEILQSKDYGTRHLRAISQSYKMMLPGAQKTLWSFIVHWWRGLGFIDTHALLRIDGEYADDLYGQRRQAQHRELIEDITVLLSQMNHKIHLGKYPIPSLNHLYRQYEAQNNQFLNGHHQWDKPVEEWTPLIKQQKALKAKLEKVVELAALHKEIGSYFWEIKIIEDAFIRQDNPALLAELNNDEDKVKTAGFVAGWTDLLKAEAEKRVAYEAVMNQMTDDNILARHAEFKGKVEEIERELKLIHQLCCY